MVIKGEWAEPCKHCGAMDSCCETSKARLETADGLALLVGRQSEKIRTMGRELDEARQVIGDLRAAAVKP